MQLTSTELYGGIEHLYASVRIIDKIGNDLYNGVIVSNVSTEDIKEGYLQCNKSRLFIKDQDELLEPALGSMYSVFCMLTQLSETGFTITGIRSILKELNDAKMAIAEVIEEMENLLSMMR